MRFEFICLLTILSLVGRPMLGQTAKARKSGIPEDTSKAHAWAETVTDFVTDQRLVEISRMADVEKRVNALIPLGSLISKRRNVTWYEEPGVRTMAVESVRGNLEKGVAHLEYEFFDGGDEVRVDRLTVDMPKTDPSGVDVLSRAVACVKRKLHRPWESLRIGNNYYWRTGRLSVAVETEDITPHTHGKPISGDWVSVSFMRSNWPPGPYVEGRFGRVRIMRSRAKAPGLPSQAAKARNAIDLADKSKAHAWAEAVTDFVTDPQLLQSFWMEDERETFRALALPESEVGNKGFGGRSLDGNPEKGVTRIEYDLGDREEDVATVDWLTIYMPRTDPDGVDVLSHVIAAMKQKLHRPWVGFPDPENGYYWEQREELLTIRASAAGSDSSKNSWVEIHFGHVEGFGEP